MKNNLMSKNLKKSIGAALLVMVTLTGCAKKRDYKEIFKAEVQDKDSAFDPAAEYIYVPSMLEAPMTSDATRPGWQGTERLVKFRFTEKTLVAESVETDDRYKDNPANAKPVIEIPVEHMDFRCADNGNGECSNKEELVDDKDWSVKKYFKPDLSALKVQETNTLPLELDNLFKTCQSEIGSRVVDYKFERDALNIVLEKTFKVSGDCLEIHELEEVPDAATFNVRYAYSFVRRASVVAADYAPVYYPTTDENTFGFFKTELRTLTNDNRDEVSGVLPLMNRWNPNRKTIPYHLTANFAKPENKRVLEATKEAVAAVNDGLRQAGTNFQIDLQAPSDVAVGDARNSMVLMVEDPQASGVIGYGPAVTDPKTGEIVAARVVMYLGSMKKFIRSTWDEMAALEAAKIEAAKADAAASSATQSGAAKTDVILKKIASTEKLSPFGSSESKSHASRLAKFLESYTDHKATYARTNRTQNSTPAKRIGGLREIHGAGFAEFKRSLYTQKDSSYGDMKAARTFVDTDDTVKTKTFLQRRTELLSKYAYPADYLNAKGSIQAASLKELKSLPMVPWVELSEAQQNQVLDAVLPYMWVSTLVHELGHNMGLRHNFAGSEDKDNFYTENELKSHGQSADGEKPVIYSSVMDYSYSELNFLHVMGKYDVAALKFAYRREVGVKTDGGATLQKVTGSLEDMNTGSAGKFTKALIPYQYCTDENTGINPGCRRFDEGSSLVEIAQSLQRSYAERYWRSNFRNNRRSFSENDDGAYIGAIDDLMMDMRPFFETYDRLWKLFGGNPENDPEFAAADAADFRKFYYDLKQAVGIVRDVYVKTLITPGAGCIVQFVDGANKGKVQLASAKDLGGTFKSCFDPKIVALLQANQAIPVAQYGKNFQNEKAKDSTNPWADQIDTRGIWGDKLLAADYLVQRRLGVKSFDDYRGNFLDMTTFQAPVTNPIDGTPMLDAKGAPTLVEHGFDEKMVSILDGFLTNDLTLGVKGRIADEGLPEVDLTFGDGSVSALKQEFGVAPRDLHWIPYQASAGIRRAFGLPKDDAPFAEVLLTHVLSLMEDTTPNASATMLKDYYGVKSDLSTTDDPKAYAAYDLGDSHVYADPKKNTFVMNVLKQIVVVKTLAAVKDDRIDAVIAAAKKREQKDSDDAHLKINLSSEDMDMVVTQPAGVDKDGHPTMPKIEMRPKKSDLSAEEQAAAKLPSAVIEAYKAGNFDDLSAYEQILRVVVRANDRSNSDAKKLHAGA